MTTEQVTSREDLIKYAMNLIGFTREQAVEYVMERMFNGKSHQQAVNELREKGLIP
jgi:hypothetical protein